jgi:2-phosphosulfolactate phosphatase
MSWYSQEDSKIRFEWGLDGATRLSPFADVTVVVDVLSFSTCVDVAVSRGAIVLPYFFKDERAQDYAKSNNAQLANPNRSKTDLCLSPSSLSKLNFGDRVVLPSPNGSTISFSVENSKVLCGSLRNAKAVARAAAEIGKTVLVIAAGELWDGKTLRPSLEDVVGAGAILSCLSGAKSVEAQAAIKTFEAFEHDLATAIKSVSSGKELIERGYPEDCDLAAQLNVSNTVPILKNKAFSKLN